MKRIYYLLGFIAAAIAFSSCNPLDKTYKDLGNLPTPTGPIQTFNVTLAASDYGILPTGNYAKTSFYFKTKDDAAASIPTILASKYPNYANKSSATVTYATAPVAIKPYDSLLTHISYTLTNSDYTPILGANPKYIELTSAQIITWLTNTTNPLFVSPHPNQLAYLTYINYDSGITPAAVTVTDTFVFLNGVWVKCYTISMAQFAYVGNGYGDFSSSDGPLINTYLSTILKADLGLTLKAKAGDVKYVSYKYYGGSNYQRIQPMFFDGTNWVATSLPQSLAFVKTNGVWAADNTVTYTLSSADYSFINNTSVNIASARANVAQYGDFNISTPLSPTTGWSDADINTVIGLILAHDYPNAVANQKFVITYAVYNGATISVTKTFVYSGTTFVYTP